MLTVCTSSTDACYATCADVMDLLYGSTTTAVVSTTQDIDRIGRAAVRASAWAETRIGRGTLAAQVYQETLAGYGTPDIMLSRYPVVKVLRFFDSTTTETATAICSTDFRIDRESGIINRDGAWGWTNRRADAETCFSLGLEPTYLPGHELRPYLVEYVAGYFVVGSTTTCFGVSTADEAYTTGATLPQDIVQAVAIRAVEVMANPTNVQSRTVGDLSVTFRTRGGAGGERSEAEQILDQYRSAG